MTKGRAVQIEAGDTAKGAVSPLALKNCVILRFIASSSSTYKNKPSLCLCARALSCGIFLCQTTGLRNAAILRCFHYKCGGSNLSTVFAHPPRPNHAKGVYGIRNLLRYGIATKSRMESSRSDVWHQSEGEIHAGA